MRFDMPDTSPRRATEGDMANRKLLLQMHISLDGKVTSATSTLDWTTQPWTPDLKAYITSISASADHILLGRKLAEGFIPHWRSHPELEGAEKINGMGKTVVSRSLKENKWDESVEVAGADVGLEEVVGALKARKGERDVITYGGAEMARGLVERGLVDELFLIAEPVSLGDGAPGLFSTRKEYVLVGARAFECGVSVAHYRKKQ